MKIGPILIEKLRKYQKAKNLSTFVLAFQIGISEFTYLKIVTNTYHHIYSSTLDKIKLFLKEEI